MLRGSSIWQPVLMTLAWCWVLAGGHTRGWSMAPYMGSVSHHLSRLCVSASPPAPQSVSPLALRPSAALLLLSRDSRKETERRAKNGKGRIMPSVNISSPLQLTAAFCQVCCYCRQNLEHHHLLLDFCSDAVRVGEAVVLRKNTMQGNWPFNAANNNFQYIYFF